VRNIVTNIRSKEKNIDVKIISIKTDEKCYVLCRIVEENCIVRLLSNFYTPNVPPA